MIGSQPIGSHPIAADTALAPAADELISNIVVERYPVGLSVEPNYDTDAFKDNVSSGTCLEYFNGRLYFAINNYVYCTKAFDVEHVDVRYMVVAGFPENVTGIGRVNDGLYIGTGKNTYFLRGTSPMPEDGGFEQTHISKYGMIPGTLARFQADLVQGVKGKDTVVFWTNDLGVHSGSDGGAYTCLSLNQITVPTGDAGAAMIIENNGIYQYVVCFNVTGTHFINSAGQTVVSPDATDTIVVNIVTGTHSRYTGYAFSSFFRFQDKWYGSNSTGVYLLEGDKDFAGEANADIEGSITTPTIDFDEECNKSVSDIFINARASDDILCDVYVNEEVAVEDLTIIYNESLGLQRKRVMVPRGLKGNSWQFKVKNSNGAYFKLFDFEVSAAKLQRTI